MRQSNSLHDTVVIATDITEATKEIIIPKLSDILRLGLTIDWAELTGTRDIRVDVYQRSDENGAWYQFNTDTAKGDVSFKVLDTVAGSYSFKWPEWDEEAVKIKITKNNTTGGTIKVNLAMR